jgi:hypothetical protein
MKQFPKRSLSNIVLILVLLALAVPVGRSLYTYAGLARSALTFRFPIDYGEGPLLDQTLRLASGEQIYDNDFSTPPYTISNYPPVFLLVQAPLAKLFGPAYWYGRLISILSALLTALFIGLTLHTLTGDIVSSVVGGLLLLTIPYIQFWSNLDRIDTLALMFSWAALFVLVRWPDRLWGILLTAALLVLSIYTRQSYALAAPLAAFVWLFFERSWRKAVQLALITGGAAAVLFLLINLLTSGGFFLNIVTANVNPFFWNAVRETFENIGKHFAILLVIILLFLVLERFRGRTRTWMLALPYLIGATLSAITIGKDGSNVNYLFELSAAFAFTGGAAMAWIGRNAWLKAAVAAALFFQVAILNQWVQEDFANRVMGHIREEKMIEQLFKEVQQSDGIVLADEFMGLVPLAGKRLYFQPFEYKMLADGGIWDEKNFLQDIADQKFDLILQYQPPYWDAQKARWTPAQRRMVREYYDRSYTSAFTWVQRPK